MQKATTIILAIFLSGCSNWCAKHYQVPVVTIDSSRVISEIKYRDTTIYIQIPGKVRVDSIPVVVQIAGTPPRITPNRVHSELEYCRAEAWIMNQKLFLELSQKDTILATKIRDAIRVQSVTITNLRREVVENIKKQKDEYARGLKEGKDKGRRQGATGILVGIVICLLVYYYVKSKI